MGWTLLGRYPHKNQNRQGDNSMKDFDKIEYEQISQDWRHRDVLTWQIPAVLVVVGGFLVAQAFDMSPTAPSWIKNGLLLFAAALAVCLTAALGQNLILQEIDAQNLKRIYSQTQRVCFRRTGSWLLFGLSVVVSVVLIVLLFLSLIGKI